MHAVGHGVQMFAEPCFSIRTSAFLGFTIVQHERREGFRRGQRT